MAVISGSRCPLGAGESSKIIWWKVGLDLLFAPSLALTCRRRQSSASASWPERRAKQKLVCFAPAFGPHDAHVSNITVEAHVLLFLSSLFWVSKSYRKAHSQNPHTEHALRIPKQSAGNMEQTVSAAKAGKAPSSRGLDKLSKLPTELIASICENLDKRSLHNLRLTSKHMHMQTFTSKLTWPLLSYPSRYPINIPVLTL